MSTPPAFSIRAAEPRDLDGIVRLIAGLAEFERLTHLLEVTPEKLRPHLFGARPVAEALVAEQGDALVGFALFFTNFSTFLARPGLYLEDLFVEPAQRGHGIGEALLTRLAQLAAERGCGRFEWSVLDWNEHAIRFYERMGATVMPEWRICRVAGDALTAFAARGTGGEAAGRGRPDMRSDPAVDDYAALHAGFRWQVPERFNLAEACCTRWARATPDAVAIRYEHENGTRRVYTYGELDADADRLAAACGQRGVARGDRVAIVMPQRFETAVAHMALFRLGAVGMPLSMLFGPEALEYRINDSGARLALVDESGIDNVLAARALCPQLATIVAVGEAQGRGDADWRALLGAAGEPVVPVDTGADDPAVLIYTSGTTGPPKGALLPHRVLIGNLPGFVCSQNWFFPLS